MGAIGSLLYEEVPLGQVTWQNQKSVPYDFFPGGVEKFPNLYFFAIISQTLLAKITKPFALWSPHVATSYDLSFDATSIKIQISFFS
jgi:hypothetical protein